MSGISWWDEHQTLDEATENALNAPIDGEARSDEYQPAPLSSVPSMDDGFPEPVPGQLEFSIMGMDTTYMDATQAIHTAPPDAAAGYAAKSYDESTVEDTTDANAQKLLLAPNEELRIHVYNEPMVLCCIYGDVNVLCNNMMPKKSHFLPTNSMFWIHSNNGACISLRFAERDAPAEFRIHSIRAPGGEEIDLGVKDPVLSATQLVPPASTRKSGFRMAKGLKKPKEVKTNTNEESKESTASVQSAEPTEPAEATSDEKRSDPAEEKIPDSKDVIDEVKLIAEPGIIQLFKGTSGPISVYQEYIKSLIISPRLSTQNPYRVLIISDYSQGELVKAISCMLVNLSSIFGMSSILVDLDPSGRGLVNVFPKTVSAVMLEESLEINDSFEKCVPIIFPTGEDTEGTRFTKACVGLSKTMIDSFIVQRAGMHHPPFGGTVVLCPSTNLDVIKGITSLFEVTDIFVFDESYGGSISKDGLNQFFASSANETPEVKVHSIPYMTRWDCKAPSENFKWREYFFGRVTPLIPYRVSIPIDELEVVVVSNSGEISGGTTFENIRYGQVLAVSQAHNRSETPIAPIAGFCVFQGFNIDSTDEEFQSYGEIAHHPDDNGELQRVVLLAPGPPPFPSKFLIPMDITLSSQDLLA
ncbi:3'-5' exonuclease [Perkinsela sp. CCAP 1560/4]|nr:3'-5' exonuclease [Perkinsela sp. CCAP 1560/4]|eukprot:KNH07495.1 3'-5' exonuclease [Perkinsela sp. CCAP 1560/4]